MHQPDTASPHDAPSVRPAALRPREAAAYLAIGRTKLYELIGTGAIRTVRLSSTCTLVPVSELDGWLQRELSAACSSEKHSDAPVTGTHRGAVREGASNEPITL